jgi:hypothetical protein
MNCESLSSFAARARRRQSDNPLHGKDWNGNLKRLRLHPCHNSNLRLSMVCSFRADGKRKDSAC